MTASGSGTLQFTFVCTGVLFQSNLFIDDITMTQVWVMNRGQILSHGLIAADFAYAKKVNGEHFSSPPSALDQ
jgi:hypothetical protein